MGIIGWIILGLLAGALAKAIMPGTQGGGWLATMALGIVGALVGGFLASALFDKDGITNFFSVGTWVTAVIGSLIVLFVWGLLTKNRRA